MKTIIYTLTLLILSTSIKGQNYIKQDESGRYVYKGIEELQGVSKTQLYTKTLEYLAQRYNSANDVIQHKDPDAGKVIVKGNFATSLFSKKGHIRHTLTIDFKEGKFRFNYSSFIYSASGTSDMYFDSKKFYYKKKLLAEAEMNAVSFVNGLKNYLKSSDSDDDW